MLGKSKEEIENIKDYFIQLLDNPILYSHFSFDEIVYYFPEESELFDEEEKEKIIFYIYKHFENFCNAKNEMVPFILLDFIIRNMKQKIRKKYVYLIRQRKMCFTKKELRYIDILENGFPNFEITTFD